MLIFNILLQFCPIPTLSIVLLSSFFDYGHSFKITKTLSVSGLMSLAV